MVFEEPSEERSDWGSSELLDSEKTKETTVYKCLFFFP